MIMMMRQQAALFITLFSVSIFAAASPSTMRLELIHRHSPHHDHIMGMAEFGWRPKSRLEKFQELIRIDQIRHGFISSQRMAASSRRIAREMMNNDNNNNNNNNNNNQNGTSTSQLKMFSGADDLIALYLVTIKVGMPAKFFLVAVDTGSDLTWVRCKFRGGKNSNLSPARRRRQAANQRRVFVPKRSSSFQSIPCSSQMCQDDLALMCSLVSCPTPSAPCAYDYRYLDGSFTLGMFAKEMVSLPLINGRKARVRDVLIGCSKAYRGGPFGAANGMLGLGYSKYSFAHSVAKKLGGKFSYCLVDHLSHKNVSNYLTFGESHNKTMTQNMQFTRLVLGVVGASHAVNVVGISVNDVLLPILPAVWDLNDKGGMILDSGASLTFLAEPAYQPVMDALTAPLLQRFKRAGSVEGLEKFEYCFDSAEFDVSLVPKLAFHFEGGAKLQPPVKSYVIDMGDGLRCVGLVSTPWPTTSIIGNVMQQNHLWEFDIIGEKLGFAPSSCS